MSNNNAGPGDVLFGGLIAIIAAGIGLGLALSADLSDGETLLLTVIAALAGIAGHVLVGIGVVAYGVSFGIRHAEGRGRQKAARPQPPVRPGQPNGNNGSERPVPPWDTPEGRSYR
jgi:hypothetical protein